MKLPLSLEGIAALVDKIIKKWLHLLIGVWYHDRLDDQCIG